MKKALLILPLLFLAGCGSKDEGGTTPPANENTGKPGAEAIQNNPNADPNAREMAAQSDARGRAMADAMRRSAPGGGK